MPIGLTLPFARTTSSLGYLAFSTTQLEAAAYNLKSLVLTNWGERPNHYYLGCNLIEFLFEQSRDDVEEKIRERIESQVQTWLPYIRIEQIAVDFKPDISRINVGISFALESDPDQLESLEITVG